MGIRAAGALRLAGVACLAAAVRAQEPTCFEYECSEPINTPHYDQHDLTIAAANATVDAASCAPTYVNETSGAVMWADCACGCGAAHRVAFWSLGALLAFYTVVIFLFVSGVTILRAGPRKKYEELRAAGKIKEDTQEIGGDSSRAWMSKSEDEVRTECGLDAAVYLLHNRQCAMFWLGQAFTIGIVLLCTYRFGGDYSQEQMLFTYSSANVSPNNGLKWIPVLAQFWLVATTVAFTVWKQKGMDSMKLEAEEEGGRHTSLNTVWISNIPTDAKEDTLRSWFEDNHGDDVVEAKMVWDVNALGHNIRGRRRLIYKINALTDQVASNPDDAGSAKTKLKIDNLTQQVKKLEQWEPDLRGRTERSAGHAFVTFKSESATAAFRQGLAAKQSGAVTGQAASLGVSQWTAIMAPRTAEIYWENFGLEPAEKLQNQIKAMALTLVMFLVFVLAALGAFWVLGFVYMRYLYWVYPLKEIGATNDGMKDAVGGFVWYGVFGVFFAVMFLGLEEEMSPIIKFVCKFETPFTKSHKQSSYLAKMFWFYMIYHVALSTVLLGVLALWCDVRNVPVVPGGCAGVESAGPKSLDPDKCRSGRLQLYVESVGIFHQNRLYLTSCVIDCLHVLEALSFFTRKAHTLGDEELAAFDGAEDEEDEKKLLEDEADAFFSDKFDYTRNYAESIAVFTSICTYSTMHPTMFLLGSSYYAIKYYVDKYQITNQYSKPHVQYGRRARTTTIYILWAQTIGQYLNAMFHLVLTGDYAVGFAMLFSAFIMQVVTALYVYQPDSLKLKKTTSRAANKIERLESEDGETEERPMCGVYKPPRAADLAVNVEIKDVAAPVKMDNPMGSVEDDEEESE